MCRPKTKPIVFSDYKNGFRTKISTNTTNETPKVVFLRCKVHITPLKKQKSYENEILSIKNDFINKAKSIIRRSAYYDNNYILNVEISEKSVCFKKKSHFHYDIFLKPKNDMTIYKNKEILDNICVNLNEFLEQIFQKNYFNIILGNYIPVVPD